MTKMVILTDALSVQVVETPSGLFAVKTGNGERVGSGNCFLTLEEAVDEAVKAALAATEKAEEESEGKITASRLMNAGQWDRFCELRGWNPWIVNEGLLDGNEDLNLTTQEMAALLGVTQ